MRKPACRSALAASFAALFALAPGLSFANGRFPIADQLVVDPNDPSHIVLRTTYGILHSSDAGGSWAWTCEGAVGYGGTQDPAMGVMADGTVLAGIFEGLSISHDRGCSWAFQEPLLKDEYVIDVSVHRDEPSRAVAITSTGMGSSGFHVILAETSDNGVTWTQAGNAITSDMIALTVDVAPSTPNRVYVSGIVGKAYAPAIERSDDRGVTWTRVFLEAAYAKYVPFLAAIDPTNPDRVYVRLSGTNDDRLLVSDDGAQTFTEVFTSASDLLGFALSPDGSRVAIGSPVEGIHIASATDLAFQQVSPIQTRCLTWTPDALYACANEFVDKFTVGVSKDEGKTFAGIYKLAEICPIACPSGGTTPGACASSWPSLADTLGVNTTLCGENVTSSSSSSGGSSSSTSAPGNDGCSCQAAGLSEKTSFGLVALGAALAAFFRRRKSY